MDPIVVANIVTSLVGLQGLANIFATEACVRTYGIDINEDVITVTRQIGYTQVAKTTAPLLILVFGMESINSAIAYSMLPFVFGYTLDWTDGTFQTPGVSQVFERFGVGGWLFVCVALIASKEYNWAETMAETATKVWFLAAASYFGILRSKPYWVVTRIFAYKRPISKGAEAWLKGYGDIGLSFVVQSLALLNGIDPLQSIGYSWAFAALYLFVELFVTNEWEALGVEPSKGYIWLVISLVAAHTLLSE